jgi:hypothetical protein
MEKLYIRVENGKVVGHPMLAENVIQVCMMENEIHYEGVTHEYILSHGFAVFDKPTLKTGEYVINEDNSVITLGEDGIARPTFETAMLTQAEKVDFWVRRPRNYDLAQSDWTQMPDAPLSAAKKTEWAAYRQELRDLTTVYANVQDPKDVVPPTKPEK